MESLAVGAPTERRSLSAGPGPRRTPCPGWPSWWPGQSRSRTVGPRRRPATVQNVARDSPMPRISRSIRSRTTHCPSLTAAFPVGRSSPFYLPYSCTSVFAIPLHVRRVEPRTPAVPRTSRRTANPTSLTVFPTLAPRVVEVSVRSRLFYTISRRVVVNRLPLWLLTMLVALWLTHLNRFLRQAPRPQTLQKSRGQAVINLRRVHSVPEPSAQERDSTAIRGSTTPRSITWLGGYRKP